jgi:hypothetical protein
MYYNKETNTLDICWYFNEKLKNIPEDTKNIIFDNDSIFNHKIDIFPQNLTHLTFGEDFNQKVNILPKNLIYLTFGEMFNQKIDNLPKNLTCLVFGCSFNQKVNNLPKTIKKLSLFNCNNLINNIPKYIENINIKFCCNQKVENLPSTLKEIIIDHEINKKYIKKPFGCILTIKKLNN